MDFINIWLDAYNKKKDITNFKNTFKLPIETLSDKIEINQNIIEDLELKNTKIVDISNNNETELDNLYCSVFNPSNIFEKLILNNWASYYSNNKDYLLNTQQLLREFKHNVSINENLSNNSSEWQEDIYNSLDNIFHDNAFIEKYQYIDLPFFDKYNNNEICLQALSINNLSAPIISLIIPIIFLILPFFIIKLQGFKITLDAYIKHLKIVFNNHILGQFFTQFNESSISSKIYLLFSLGFYLFQIYQNIINSTRYFKNIKYILNTLAKVKNYITNSINSFTNLLKYTKNYITYNNFNEILENNKLILEDYFNELNKITNYNYSIKKLFDLGFLLKCFYKLYDDDNLIGALHYSFGFNGYIDNITNIQKLIKNKNINFCNFINNNDKPSFKNAYYSNLLLDTSSNIVKNSYKLDNNLTLTGPNAAGKTTLLKSTLFNTLLCQQLGCGFFDNANVRIYDHIHCYINIPDTSSRDSLFQAEARRCKDILECIENNKDKNHLCVFDEIYSGTNPDEAVKSAYGYLKYLNNLDNVNYILTTHYHKLCKKLISNTNKNYHMVINDNNGDFNFTYKIKKGISKVKGGIKVLKDLNYPEHIIKNISN
tara:strand:- start:1045 stop:2844 length:1800 start_codon:yes stop_codon:yes gene_type:complete